MWCFAQEKSWGSNDDMTIADRMDREGSVGLRDNEKLQGFWVEVIERL